jgi:hypothetical protein
MCYLRKRVPEHKATRLNGFLCSHATRNATIDAKNIFLDPEKHKYTTEKVRRDGKSAIGFSGATSKRKRRTYERDAQKYA